MKKNIIWIIFAVIIVGIIAFFIFNNKNNDNQSNPSEDFSSTKTLADINEEYAENRVSNILENSNEILQNNAREQEISSYSTVIKDNSAGRLTNINITCSTLNNTIISAGETFSFNKVVGQPTAEKGYQEASVIIDHKTEKGIGGGNCQVSSTLYNAVLTVPSLSVIERHEHGKDVTYVPEGKDAAVSYGSLDLKFRNDTGKSIRIEATTDNSNITIRLIQLNNG